MKFIVLKRFALLDAAVEATDFLLLGAGAAEVDSRGLFEAAGDLVVTLCFLMW